MDPKAMPVHSYHGYNYFLIIIDNATSHSWTINLKQKSNADPAIWQFIAMVKLSMAYRSKRYRLMLGVNLNLMN